MNNEIKSAQEIEQIEIEKLLPYEDNPNTHDKSKPELLKAVQKHGFYNPLIIDQNNRIVCGHNRLSVAKELGMKEVPCVRVSLEDKEYVSVMTSDNKIAALSSFNKKTLKVCLQIIDGVQNTPAGFDPSEIDKMFGHKAKDNSDESDEVNFGESGTIKVESDEDNAGIIKRKIFQFTPSQHEEVTAKLLAYKKEHGLENEAQALIKMLSGFKKAPKTVKKAGPVKVMSNE